MALLKILDRVLGFQIRIYLYTLLLLLAFKNPPSGILILPFTLQIILVDASLANWCSFRAAFRSYAHELFSKSWLKRGTNKISDHLRFYFLKIGCLNRKFIFWGTNKILSNNLQSDFPLWYWLPNFLLTAMHHV